MLQYISGIMAIQFCYHHNFLLIVHTLRIDLLHGIFVQRKKTGY